MTLSCDLKVEIIPGYILSSIAVLQNQEILSNEKLIVIILFI